MTLLPLADRLRIAFNRDESRKRPPALPPELRTCGARRAVMPIDPISDGTWIGGNDAGLVAALLNLYRFDKQGREPHKGTHSRGEIIPRLLECTTVDAAVESVVRMRRSMRFSPFSLVITDGRCLREFKAHAGAVSITPPRSIERPEMFTSSGLGDALVYSPRNRLFEEMFAQAREPIAAQDAFHRHQWPDRPELSVCMARREARTVSLTVVEMRAGETSLHYHAAPPNEPVGCVDVTLPLEAAE